MRNKLHTSNELGKKPFATIESWTTVFSLLDSDWPQEKFALRLEKTKEPEKPYVLFVIAKGCTDPLDYVEELYDVIISFLTQFNVSLQDVQIYVDLLEYRGLSSYALLQWNFDNSKDLLNCNVKDIELNLDSLPEIFSKFYKDRFSAFTNKSALLNTEKIDLFSSMMPLCGRESIETLCKRLEYSLSNRSNK